MPAILPFQTSAAVCTKTPNKTNKEISKTDTSDKQDPNAFSC